jgi:1-acyl-sn-glycerol-3-phosphate acyltransferase
MQDIKNSSYQYLLKNRKTRTRFYQWFKRRIVSPIINRFLDVRVTGIENIPEGPCIIVSHHCLYFDSSVIGATLDRKAHGWIDEDAFKKPGLRTLCSLLEQIPVKTGGQASRKDYKRTKEMSIVWLENTNDLVALTNDGASRYLFDENGNIKDLASRMNYSGAASLGMDTKVPVVPTALWIPKEHQKELFVSKGLRSIKYMERNKKIPYLIYFSKPLYPSQYKNKKDLREDIRKEQLKAHEKLSNKYTR